MQFNKHRGLLQIHAKSFICICIFFVTVTSQMSYANLLVKRSEISIDKQTGVRLYQGKPFTGDAITYYPDGKKSKMESFHKGMRHGYLKQWFPSGILSFDSNYIHGYKNGETKSWWRTGKLRSLAHYQNGKVHGEVKQWYASGERFKKMNYQDGKEVGLQQAWRRNGKLYSNYEYVDGRIYGLKRSNMCYELKDEKITLNR